MQGKQQRARWMQPGGGVRGAQAFLSFGRDAYPPVSLKPSVAVAAMETAGPLQPPNAENVPLSTIQTSWLVLIPHSSFKPEPGADK